MVFILYSEKLKKCNYSTICKLFDRSMNSHWPNGIHHDKVVLFLSDAAPYTIKTGETIQLFYSKVIHVTSLAYVIHRIAETS